MGASVISSMMMVVVVGGGGWWWWWPSLSTSAGGGRVNNNDGGGWWVVVVVTPSMLVGGSCYCRCWWWCPSSSSARSRWPLIMCKRSHTMLPWVEESSMYVQWDLEKFWSVLIITSAFPTCNNIVTPLPTTTYHHHHHLNDDDDTTQHHHCQHQRHDQHLGQWPLLDDVTATTINNAGHPTILPPHPQHH